MVVPFKFPRRPNIFPKRLHTLSRQFETNPFASTAMEAAGALGMSAKTLESLRSPSRRLPEERCGGLTAGSLYHFRAKRQRQSAKLLIGWWA
jgi:hypothetical protein